MMWLLGFESIFVAACLWAFNNRYRKAHVRIFKCWCHENFFLKDDDQIIADVHDAKYSTPPDYASHRTRYRDTSKTVHTTIRRDRANNSESRDDNSNDVMASNSTLSNGHRPIDMDASQIVINSSQESFENTGDTDLPSTSGMLTENGVQILDDTDLRTSVKDASSDDGDTNSYLSLKRFVGESSEDLDTPLSWAGNKASGRRVVLRENGNDIEGGDEYEILHGTELNDKCTVETESLNVDTQDIRLKEDSPKCANQKSRTTEPDSNKQSNLTSGQDSHRETTSNEPDSVPEIAQYSSHKLDPKLDILQTTQRSSAESADSRTAAYTLEDIEQVLENDTNEPDSDKDVSSSESDNTKQDQIIVEPENENKNNSNQDTNNSELFVEGGSPTSELLIDNAGTIGYDNVGMEHETDDIEEEVDEFDEVFRYQQDATLWVSLADELEQAQKTERNKLSEASFGEMNTAIGFPKEEFEFQHQDGSITPRAQKFHELSLDLEIEKSNCSTHGNQEVVSRDSSEQNDASGVLFDKTGGDPQLNTVYEHFDTSEGHIEAVVETRGRGKILGTFSGVKSAE